MCIRLYIKINISIAFHFLTNEQTELINEHREYHLRIFYNYIVNSENAAATALIGPRSPRERHEHN